MLLSKFHIAATVFLICRLIFHLKSVLIPHFSSAFFIKVVQGIQGGIKYQFCSDVPYENPRLKPSTKPQPFLFPPFSLLTKLIFLRPQNHSISLKLTYCLSVISSPTLSCTWIDKAYLTQQIFIQIFKSHGT